MKKTTKIVAVVAATAAMLTAGAFGVHTALAAGDTANHVMTVSADAADGTRSLNGVNYDLYLNGDNGYEYITGCAGTVCTTDHLQRGEYRMVPMGEDAKAKGATIVIEDTALANISSVDADEGNGIVESGDTLMVSVD